MPTIIYLKDLKLSIEKEKFINFFFIYNDAEQKLSKSFKMILPQMKRFLEKTNEIKNLLIKLG